MGCTGRYYHAGVEVRAEGECDYLWSPHTRRTMQRARREARTMAARTVGGVPVVESWSRDHGLRPGSAEAADECVYVD